MFLSPAPIPIVVVGTTWDLVVAVTSEVVAFGLWWYLQRNKREDTY